MQVLFFFFFSSRRRHTRCYRDWSSDVCSSDLSQGSEYPAVVIPLTTSAWMMLQRNLLYTGITRAKKLVVLAGSRRALAAAVRTAGAGRRHTALAHRLQSTL